MKAKLYYVYDPMCSWCWGYAPTWKKLENELNHYVDIQYRLGGLAEDSDQAMNDDMQQFLKQTWQKISQQLGTQFNFDFWQICQPRRSTYPACRAVLIARKLDKESEMLAAIQQAYYLQAKNPSNLDVLITLAAEIGLNSDEFTVSMGSEITRGQLMAEIDSVRAMPISGFPSLVLVHNNQSVAIPIDYKNWKTSFNAVLKEIHRCQ